MIFLFLSFFPSTALFMLTTWPFGPLPPRSLLRWRLHKERWFDWNAGLNSDVFLLIQENVRPCSFQWITTKLTSTYSTHPSASIPLQLSLVSPIDRTFPFSTRAPLLPAELFPPLKALRYISASSWVLLKSPFPYCTNLFFGSFSLMLHPNGFLFLALPTLPNRSSSIKRLVAPSPTASHPPLSRFSSLRCRYLPYESLFHLMSGPSSSNLLSHFRFARRGVKPRFSMSSWRAFASTYSYFS